MHLQESTLFDLDLQVKVTLNVAQCPLHHVTYAPTKFEVTTSKLKEENHLQEIQYLTLTLGSRSKIEVARSISLGGDTFTRKFNI